MCRLGEGLKPLSVRRFQRRPRPLVFPNTQLTDIAVQFGVVRIVVVAPLHLRCFPRLKRKARKKDYAGTVFYYTCII